MASIMVSWHIHVTIWWVVFVKVIFLWLNLKPDDGFYLTACLRFLIELDIAWQTLKFSETNLSQCCTQSFFGRNGTYIYCVLECNWRPSTMVGACVKNFFKSLGYLDWLKKWTSPLVYGLFTNLVLKHSSSIFGCPYWFNGTNIPLCTTH